MDLVFYNQGKLSLVDITTMGDSCKRDDPSKIGEFDSGLKYALAILFRNGIKVSIVSGGTEFEIGSKTITPDHKTKEVLTINGEPTAFSPQLGHNWDIWMAYRELYSNCLDEGGGYEWTDEPFDVESETLIVVHDCDLNREMQDKWSNYFNTSEPVYEKGYVKVYEHVKDDHLRLYKNGILVYEDHDIKSQYAYDYLHASIDERRTLNDKNTFENRVAETIQECNDTSFIQSFINGRTSNSFEEKIDYYWSFSDEWVTLMNETHKTTPVNEHYIYISLFKCMLEDNRFKLGFKSITHSPTSYGWGRVKVEVMEKEESFEEKVKKECLPFKFNYPVHKSNIEGFKCLPDKSSKILYVTEDFTKEYLWQVVKAVFRLDGNDNPDYAYKKYVELLK